ncbi:type IV secretion protein Rhs [Aggregatibacter actinomycetemcomitans]|uniref:hypothetical protein n=1 Tax=Aggregatibacter actinomycetemcomitans TaxID=714 RepID=UPI00197C0A59|nr:hypothetical protein [Aggregatibacter actinomycetemcomitans]MBN6075099.1 type IV secretion protein Rhs [Aggregatibacter actinomycetemcomitans]
MTYDDELLRFISEMNNAEILEDVDEYIEFLSDNFKFVGSKISLKGEQGYCDYTFDKWEISSIYPFFELNSKVKNKITSSESIYYIGDNLTEIGVVFNGIDFFRLLDFLIHNIPEHYYFFSIKDKWCLFVATEGYVEYGEK